MVFPIEFLWLFLAAMVISSDPEYQKYVTTVPILLPFIPLYSVKKHKWLVA